jgi:alkylresorcinol/alkylpyrone synthase
VTAALWKAGLDADQVDFILFTSVTGISAPSIDARLVPLLGLRPDIKRLPSFGLGCVAGAAGIARVHDYLEGHPNEIALLVSVELCSLTLQRDDASVANFVASGLFGDGATAVLMAGDLRAASLGIAGPTVIGTRSALYPDSESVIGWDIGGTGFRIVLSAGVADTIDANVATDVRELLEAHGLGHDDVGAWIAHPGGPRVLEAFERGLDLERSDLAASWASLDAVGNLSSSSVLHVLSDMIEQPEGTHGMLFALGPGVTSEYVLMRWAA